MLRFGPVAGKHDGAEKNACCAQPESRFAAPCARPGPARKFASVGVCRTVGRIRDRPFNASPPRESVDRSRGTRGEEPAGMDKHRAVAPTQLRATGTPDERAGSTRATIESRNAVRPP
jgi:hypothetical protein